MTKNFNPQKRAGARPPFRDAPSSNTSYGQQGFSQRPGRPRVNRASIDQAWQDGAQRTHADYRPRTTGNNRPSSSNNGPSYGQYSRPAHRNGAPTNNRSNSHTGSYSGSAPQRQTPYQEQRPSYQEQRRPAGNPSNPRSNYARPRHEQQDQEPRQERYSSHGGPRAHHTAPRRPFTGSGRFEREQGSQARRDRQFEGDYESYSEEDRPRRPGGFAPRAGFQPRTQAQNSYAPTRTGFQPRTQQRQQQRTQSDDSFEKPERHVTRMSDGRVLKGPRPVQRRNAQFWNEITEGTDGLLSPVKPKQKEETRLERKRKSGATTGRQRRSIQGGKPKGEKKPRTRNKGPRPSQRGHQWPTAESAE